MQECLLAFQLMRAWNLPKTDSVSKIDPYFKIKFLATKQKSNKLDDTDAPTVRHIATAAAPTSLPD